MTALSVMFLDDALRYSRASCRSCEQGYDKS
jgi:hypothetical protein